MFSIKKLKIELNTSFIGQDIIYKDKTISTNDDIWKYVHKNHSEGILIISEEQKQGRGRRKTKWFSKKGKSLTFSFLLFPQIAIEKISLLPLLSGVSIVKGIYESTNILTGLKWPNDIYLNKKKLAGILIESRTINSKLAIVIGVGININETKSDIPISIRKQTISLCSHSGIEYEREFILASILNYFEKLYLYHLEEIVPIWKKYCIHINNEVSFHSTKKQINGKFLGITDAGFAQIEINGNNKIFSTGILDL